jgi:glycerophosphoryl diester phosphodiesterase
LKPLVIAHRGASAYAPENTLAAFNLAFEMGADGIELDVSLTKDGVPVVFHFDPDDQTHGVRSLKDLTLDQVKQIDAGAWFAVRFRGERIPTLFEVLEGMAGRGLIDIELKSNTLQTDGLEAAVAKVIEETNVGSDVLLSSFSPFALYRMSVLNPRLPRGLLYAGDMPLYLRRAWLRPLARPNALHPRWLMVNDRYINWARGKGYKINVWTVDDADEMHRLSALGVDAIITNKPDLLRQVLAKNT